jgi:hypothetical protein
MTGTASRSDLRRQHIEASKLSRAAGWYGKTLFGTKPKPRQNQYSHIRVLEDESIRMDGVVQPPEYRHLHRQSRRAGVAVRFEIDVVVSCLSTRYALGTFAEPCCGLPDVISIWKSGRGLRLYRGPALTVVA